ncbi:MAG: hypothetical protein CENE_01169 [Candidatus Celerinatantimonas neptuna]|nr:MAG: hypothetical protein CENE_01169 [Candidatus Celerinatantimonas neptuna]
MHQMINTNNTIGRRKGAVNAVKQTTAIASSSNPILVAMTIISSDEIPKTKRASSVKGQPPALKDQAWGIVCILKKKC